MKTPFAIDTLLDPRCFSHPVGELRLVETHISWVVLTGNYAYKIKKPLDLGFLDFSTLDRRHFFCQEELRLNRRLAPGIYLDVLPVTEGPRMGGDGPVLEYAVQMRQFPQEALLDRQLTEGRLATTTLDALARLAGRFHRGLSAAPPESHYGTPAAAHAPVSQNFVQIRPLLKDPHTLARLKALEAWANSEHTRLLATLAERKTEGFIRECHGDMHLGNVAELDGRVIVFDGIEFNPDLRWIDVMSELAFLVSDLEHRGRGDLAWRTLNTYLEVTGDYPGLDVLRYYQAYRAMVRAKVTRIRLAQTDLGAGERAGLSRDFQGYLTQAEGYAHPSSPVLVITRGPSGAGKSVISQALLERLGAVRLRSDVERKRLFGLEVDARSGSPVNGGIYTPEAGARTFTRLRELAGILLRAGYPVIVDATFLDRAARTPFKELAMEMGVPFRILDIQNDPAVLRRRVARRAQVGEDASEAGVEVLERQLAVYGPLEGDERALSIEVDGDASLDAEAMFQAFLEGL